MAVERAVEQRAVERMPERRVWLVRHGYRLDYVHPRWPVMAEHPADSPLSQQGLHQAQELVSAFATSLPAHTFVSPYLRTLQTVAPLARTYGLSLKVEPGIGEIHQGHQSSLSLSSEERGQYFPQIDSTYSPEWVPVEIETRQRTVERVGKVLQSLLLRYEGDLLFVTHETPLRAIVDHLLEQKIPVRCTFCGITELQRQKNQWQLTQNGKVSHLSHSTSAGQFAWDYFRRQMLMSFQSRTGLIKP